jgi:small subunit ribosomal protein S20
MPITKAAKKAVRQNKRKRKRNAKKKEGLHDALKEFRELASQGKKAEAKKMLPRIYKSLDKLAKTGIIKKNTAARKKSRAARLVERGQD